MVAARRDVDMAGPRLSPDPMLDGVLDKRLEDERWHEGVQRVFLDVVANDEAIGEAGALDLEILPEELDLGLERSLLLPEAFQAETQQVAQADERAVGGINVAVHQGRDRVERVEEEVRVQLLLERLQLRGHQARFQL